MDFRLDETYETKAIFILLPFLIFLPGYKQMRTFEGQKELLSAS
jgi:hypothetical protein